MSKPSIVFAHGIWADGSCFQKLPVTLYVEQWEKLLAFGDEIRQFLKEHDSELKRKPKSETRG